MAATISSAGQWTRLATNLAPLRDTAFQTPGSGSFTGGLPALDPSDLANLPGELLAFIHQAAYGLAASFFNNAAPTIGTTAVLNPLATALLIRQLLTFYIERGFPGHDQLGTRGQL